MTRHQQLDRPGSLISIERTLRNQDYLILSNQFILCSKALPTDDYEMHLVFKRLLFHCFPTAEWDQNYRIDTCYNNNLLRVFNYSNYEIKVVNLKLPSRRFRLESRCSVTRDYPLRASPQPSPLSTLVQQQISSRAGVIFQNRIKVNFLSNNIFSNYCKVFTFVFR